MMPTLHISLQRGSPNKSKTMSYQGLPTSSESANSPLPGAPLPACRARSSCRSGKTGKNWPQIRSMYPKRSLTERRYKKHGNAGTPEQHAIPFPCCAQVQLIPLHATPCRALSSPRRCALCSCRTHARRLFLMLSAHCRASRASQKSTAAPTVSPQRLESRETCIGAP